jgi:zinc and cadmium transporter
VVVVAGLSTLAPIVAGGLLMSLITLVGGLTALLTPRLQQRLLLPLIALAAGSLLGGSLFHMLPQGLEGVTPRRAGVLLAAGFTSFLALEQLLHWHHSHRPQRAMVQPLALLVLLGDGLHNLVGGLGIASTYLIDPAAGVAAWLAAAAHELPQELGDYGVLVHSGLRPAQALRWNFISGLSFPLGALIAWCWAGSLPLAALVLFAAGNFLYITASDLVPEIKAPAQARGAARSLVWFIIGLLLLWLLAVREA